MLVWRLTRKDHADNSKGGNPLNHPLSGEGARRYGGLRNHPGTAIVYTSASLSLAVLEYLVNLSIFDLPDDLVAVEIKIPDNLRHSEIAVADLPKTGAYFPQVRN